MSENPTTLVTLTLVLRFFEVTWRLSYDAQEDENRTELAPTEIRLDPTYIRCQSYGHGCQIILATTYQNVKNVPNNQNKCIPNGSTICQHLPSIA
jgi:hypothetical protein